TASSGARSVVDEMPSGHGHDSPQVGKIELATGQAGDTHLAPAALAAPHGRTQRPAASPKRPRANFTAIEGLASRAASQVQNQPKTGAKITIKSGLIFWSILAGISHVVVIWVAI